MRDLSPLGPAVGLAASAAAAAISVRRAVANASTCSTAASGCDCRALHAAITPPVPSPQGLSRCSRPSQRRGFAADGCPQLHISRHTLQTTPYAAGQSSAGCWCPCGNHMHRRAIRDYEMGRKMTSGCKRLNQFAAVCASLRFKSARSTSRTSDAAASVHQLLLSPQAGRCSSSDLWTSRRIHLISVSAATSIFFRTCCSALWLSKSLRTSLQQKKECEEKRCDVAGHEAPTRVSMACSSFNGDNNGVDTCGVSSSHMTTNPSHAPRSTITTGVSTDTAVTDKGGRVSRTPGRLDEKLNFEGSRRQNTIGIAPLDVCAHDGIHSENRCYSSVSQPWQPTGNETGQTATTSLKFTECANSTSRRQWDMHAAALRRALHLAEFVSVDVELTGLHIRNEKFIGVDRCYEAHCEGARAFMPIQLGLCAARRAAVISNGQMSTDVQLQRQPKTYTYLDLAVARVRGMRGSHPRHPHRWVLTPASIYIFPIDSRIFQASTATLSFLRESGLDFNEWIAHGVPYMRAQEEREKRQTIEARIAELEQLKSRALEDKSNGAALAEREVPPQIFPYELATVEDKQLADTVRGAIQSWLASGSKQPLHLPVDNPLQRLLLHSLVASEFPHISSHSAKSGDQRVLAIYRSEGEVYEEQLRAMKEEILKLKQLRGVRQLLDDIADRRLVLVGHNCFYDLLHLYQTLYGDLPESVTTFKSMWTQTFPYTFDTKLIAETHEVLASLQPPATLKGLCVFMATLNAAKRENITRSAQYETEQTQINISTSGIPLPLEIQLERLPGTRWSLPTLVQSLSSTTAEQRAAVAGSPASHASNNSVDCLGKYSRSTQGVAPQTQAHPQNASNVQNIHGNSIAEPKSTLTTTEEDYSHDAGYDSLMTSVVYLLQLAHVLPYHGLRWQGVSFGRASRLETPGATTDASFSTNMSYKTRRPSERDPEQTTRTSGLEPPESAPRMRSTHDDETVDSACSVTEFFSSFLNRIRLSRTQPASINLGGKDEQLLHQKRLLFMRNHPTSWKKWEIMKIWSPVWVDVQTVNASTSWIVARDEEDAQNIVTIYQMMKHPQFELLDYDQYRALQRQESSQQQE